jgi:hypothetical protein
MFFWWRWCAFVVWCVFVVWDLLLRLVPAAGRGGGGGWVVVVVVVMAVVVLVVAAVVVGVVVVPWQSVNEHGTLVACWLRCSAGRLVVLETAVQSGPRQPRRGPIGRSAGRSVRYLSESVATRSLTHSLTHCARLLFVADACCLCACCRLSLSFSLSVAHLKVSVMAEDVVANADRAHRAAMKFREEQVRCSSELCDLSLSLSL